MLFFGRKNATDKQPLKKLLSRGMGRQKRYDLHRILQTAIFTKGYFGWHTKQHGNNPAFLCMPAIQF
jgi:hypothetical protein